MSTANKPTCATKALLGSALMAMLIAGCSSSEVAECDLSPELSAQECDTAHGLLLGELPAARGNAVGDDPGAAQLGFAMFYDARFSSNQNVRCATCHQPERRFGDGMPTSTGLATLARNAPTLLNAARYSTLHWDGRADSVWSQALLPLQSPLEMDYSLLELAHRINKSYSDKYQTVFGALPPLAQSVRFPEAGGPGEPAWDNMEEADREAILQLAANVGKAFEAYERKLVSGPAPLDDFLGGDKTALSLAEQRGLVVFLRAGCADCHGGPLLSDEGFHNLGQEPKEGQSPDLGRGSSLAALAADPFSSQGAYWDGPRPEPPPAATDADIGAFRTPSLRNVALSAPYGHDGRFATLRDVVDFHLQGGGKGALGAVGTVDAQLRAVTLSASSEDDLLAFLGSLTGEPPAPPWNNWPDK